jgi:Sap, sulfolipid-1-addressing protein
MQTLILSVGLLGLAVALSSPTSVMAVLVLLAMPSGLRRAYAFLGGWLAAIALIGLAIVLFPALNFRSSHTTPSRTASIVELVIGGLLVAGAVALHRKPVVKEAHRDPIPAWLTRLVGRHWAIALAAGGVMLTYSLTVVAMLEILKANVSPLHRSLAVAVFALTSILTIGAPIAYATVAPDRAAAHLEDWKSWLAAHTRTVGVTLLAGIGAAIILKAIFDLAS